MVVAAITLARINTSSPRLLRSQTRSTCSTFIKIQFAQRLNHPKIDLTLLNSTHHLYSPSRATPRVREMKIPTIAYVLFGATLFLQFNRTILPALRSWPRQIQAPQKAVPECALLSQGGTKRPLRPAVWHFARFKYELERFRNQYANIQNYLKRFDQIDWQNLMPY